MKAKTEPKAAASVPAAPFEPMIQAGEGWQRQMNAGLKIMDAMLESAVKLRDAQLPASSDFLARAAEMQKLMLEARSPFDLWNLQCRWMVENATRGLALWKGVFDAASAANANVFSCLREEAQQAQGSARAIGQAAVNAPGSSLAPQELVKTALVTIDAAYGQMLKNSQQMMAAATEALSAGVRGTAPAAKPGAKRG